MAKKILTVDDSRSLRQMLVVTLRSAGYDVTEAEHGAEALEIAKRQTFDLVLTDINMPVMGGIELVKHLRQLPNYKFVPVLCLTTESSDDMKSQGRTVGATGWLVKPFAPEKLLATIEKVL